MSSKDSYTIEEFLEAIQSEDDPQVLWDKWNCRDNAELFFSGIALFDLLTNELESEEGFFGDRYKRVDNRPVFPRRTRELEPNRSMNYNYTDGTGLVQVRENISVRLRDMNIIRCSITFFNYQAGMSPSGKKSELPDGIVMRDVIADFLRYIIENRMTQFCTGAELLPIDEPHNIAKRYSKLGGNRKYCTASDGT